MPGFTNSIMLLLALFRVFTIVLYLFRSPLGRSILLIYFDDIIITGDDPPYIQCVKFSFN